MQKQKLVLLLSSILLASGLLTGCGEFAYKRGASPADLSLAQEGCRKKGGDDAYRQCMEAQGWMIQKLDDWNPLMVVEPVNDGRTGVVVPVAGLATSSNSSGSKTTQPNGANSASGSVSASSAPINRNEPPDPMTLFSVSSWWKMGGNANDLKIAIASCVKQLGPAHQPVDGSNKHTRGLILCLRQAGWYGLQGQ